MAARGRNRKVTLPILREKRPCLTDALLKNVVDGERDVGQQLWGDVIARLEDLRPAILAFDRVRIHLGARSAELLP
jgi:hypothetical protein